MNRIFFYVCLIFYILNRYSKWLKRNASYGENENNDENNNSKL
jgi:hypothetical protein